MVYRGQISYPRGSGGVRLAFLLGLFLGPLAIPAGAETPTSPPQIAFEDGSIPPPLDDLARDLLSIELVREQFAPEFTGPLQSQDEFLAQHISYLASLLEDTEDAGPASRAGLRRGIAYGRDLASFTLALMLCERSRGAGSPLLHPNIHNEYGTGGLDLAWRGLRELRRDPLWVDHAPEQARSLHADTWRLKDSVVKTIAHVATGGAAVDSASLVSGAWTLARLVAFGPQLIPELARLSGLSRVAEFLRKLPQGGQARWLVTATSAGAGGPLQLVAGEGAAVRTLALTEAWTTAWCSRPLPTVDTAFIRATTSKPS